MSAVPALTTTLAPLPAQPTGRPTTTFPGKLLRTPDGNFIVGVITPTNASTYIFVYEVASGVILRNRITAGQSTVISMSPDGSRFMAGFTMYDTATLAVVAQQNNANAPFTFSSAHSTPRRTWAAAFSRRTAPRCTARSTPRRPPIPRRLRLSSTLLVNDPTNLGIRLGIKLPESIVAKIAMTSDGADAWGLSDSGLVHLPLGKLYDYPILVPETTQVFLAMDDCNRGVASGTLKINNLGKGRLTYTVAASPSAALVYKQSSGLAPSTHHLHDGARAERRGAAAGHQHLDRRRNAAGHAGQPDALLARCDQHSEHDPHLHELPAERSARRDLSGADDAEQQPERNRRQHVGQRRAAGHSAGRSARAGVHHQLRLQPHRSLRHSRSSTS